MISGIMFLAAIEGELDKGNVPNVSKVWGDELAGLLGDELAGSGFKRWDGMVK